MHVPKRGVKYVRFDLHPVYSVEFWLLHSCKSYLIDFLIVNCVHAKELIHDKPKLLLYFSEQNARVRMAVHGSCSKAGD